MQLPSTFYIRKHAFKFIKYRCYKLKTMTNLINSIEIWGSLGCSVNTKTYKNLR